MCSKKVQDNLIQHFLAHCESFYGNGVCDSQHYGRIINEAHFNRLIKLLDRSNGQIAMGKLKMLLILLYDYPNMVNIKLLVPSHCSSCLLSHTMLPVTVTTACFHFLTVTHLSICRRKLQRIRQIHRTYHHHRCHPM